MELIFIIIGLVLLAIGAYTDIKTREVPDWLNYSAIFIGLGLRALYSAVSWDYHYIAEGAIGFAAFFVIAYIMFYAGQWGGGDAKMIMGLGAIFGLWPSMTHFTVYFIVNLVIVSAAYGLCYSIVLMFMHWKRFKQKFVEIITAPEVRMIKRVVLIAVLALILIAFFISGPYTRLAALAIMCFTIIMLYLWIIIKAVEQAVMIKKILISNITEGDWVHTTITVKESAIKTVKQSLLEHLDYLESDIKKEKVLPRLFKRLITLKYTRFGFLTYLYLRINKQLYSENLKYFNKILNLKIVSYDSLNIRNNLFFNRKDVDKMFDSLRFKVGMVYICGPKDLGISKRQITKLFALKIKTVWVKYGIPFEPTFFIAFLMTLMWGNIVFLVM
jgi:Flp pilus assembly protein protease CpaA